MPIFSKINLPEPDYYRLLREKHARPDLSEFAIERSILAGWKREWSTNPETCPYYHKDVYDLHPRLEPVELTGFSQHLMRYIAMCWPKIDINSWILRQCSAFEITHLIHGRKIQNQIGSKNSGKTNWFAIIALALVSIDPKHTRAFISGPYKSAAESTVWGRIGTRTQNMREAMPGVLGSVKDMPSKQRVVFDEESDEAGYIELITLDKVGKLQGAKSLDPDRGWLVLICDEIAEFPSRALLDGLDNLTGNQNFICLTGCNFKNIEGLDGDLCRPEGREFSELDIDEDTEWLSNYKSMTWRMDGHRSPNILAGEVVCKHLLTESVRADMEAIHGPRGPKYLEQIRSFPNHNLADFYVTSRDKIKSGGGYDDYVKEPSPPWVSVAFMDPGFGGDPCKIGWFRFGPGRVQTVGGAWKTIMIFEAAEEIATIPLRTDLICDDKWIQRIEKLGTQGLVMHRGGPVAFEQQIAVAAGEFLEARRIPRNHFGYDGSMRSGIVHEMVAILGTSIHSIDFGGEATERIMARDGSTAKQLYSNHVSEMYFAFAACVQSGQFRGASLVPAAIAQIVRRSWKHVGKRRQIQPKKDYKAENQGRSPDDADTLVGGYEMALRMGFSASLSRKPSDAPGNRSQLFHELSSTKMFSRKTGRKLKT